MSRVIKPTKASFSRAYVDSEKDAERQLNETAEKLVDKSGRIGEKKRNMQKNLEDKLKNLKVSFLYDSSVIYKQNLGHLYPFSTLNEAEKMNAKMRGLIFAGLFFILYTNYYSLIVQMKLYLPREWNWVNIKKSVFFTNIVYVTITIVLAAMLYMYYFNSYERDLKGLKRELDTIPTIIEKTKQQMKDEFRDITFNNIIFTEDGTPQYENPQREPIRVTNSELNTHMGNSLLP